jgi:predicted ABC-type exoprotein transport system permease subunit
LIATKKLLEKYAVLWVLAQLSSLIVFLIVYFNPSSVQFLGFEIGSNFLIFCYLLLLSGISLQLSMELSRQERRLEKVATQIALLNEAVESLHKHLSDKDEI